MLIPGILEELTFRGIILNMQLKKYSHVTVIILNGILFGLFHLFNMLLGQDLFNTLLQVIYASFLGITLAYVYIKTKSLITCILIHYLFNTFLQIFLSGIFIDDVGLVLFIIFGIGIFPMAITITVLGSIFGKKGTRI